MTIMGGIHPVHTYLLSTYYEATQCLACVKCQAGSGAQGVSGWTAEWCFQFTLHLK